MRRYYSILSPCLFCFLAFISVSSFSQSLMVIQKMAEDPQLDGLPFESAWEAMTPLGLYMLNPVSGGVPSQKSEAKIGYTDKYLYVAGYMYDTEPDKIRAKSKKRDEMNGANDFFGISLDTYNDNENGVFFFTTPAGLRFDGQIFNDGQSGFPQQPEWNTVWDVEISGNSLGWFVEMRIPLSSIRYYSREGKVIMGMNFIRYISRLAEMDIYPKTSNEWGFWSFAKPSVFEDIEISGIESINPLYFSPYLLGGVEQQSSLNETETSYNTTTDWERQLGMDVKVGLSKSMTLDLTINTDFAQVEADDQEINLTRFSLFFPEKRQFFLERSSIFDFKFGTSGQLFYSRTIGLYEDQMVPIWGGGRLTGRAGPWDIGIMSLQTGYLKDNSTGEELLPSYNNSVARLRRKIPLNSNSYVGGLVTSKVDVNGEYNLSYGMDGIINVFGNDYLNVALAGTTKSGLDSGTGFSDLSKIFLQWQRRTYEGFGYGLNYSRAGDSFNPALGFEFRKDFSRYGSIFSYGFIPGDRSKFLRQHKLSLDAYTYVRNSDNVAETVIIKPSYELFTKKNHQIIFSSEISIENDIDTFYLSDDVYIPSGSYKFTEFQVFYQTPSYNIGYLNTYYLTGRYYDGWINSFNITPALTLGSSWIIETGYGLNDINFRERDQRFLSHLLMLKVLYMYSTTLSASSFIQYNSLIDKAIWNVRFRFNPREGNDLYLVYNDNLNSSRESYYPVLPVRSQRTFLLKYTHAFRIR
ncbi:MAG: hypothetical protein A2X03_10955 [Bacteroidetes bacterium GWA2_40_15]|nr:MAG: hypothetical protein A2X03_10955 [Bacteroidetes bacterium GWA2_40_15]